MATITFKEIYEESKDVIEKIDPRARISKLSVKGTDLINQIIGKPKDKKVKGIVVNYEGNVITSSSVKQTYVEFIKLVCKDDNSYEKLKNKGWIFSESERSTSRDDYGEIGRVGSYIYTNCNIDLLIIKFVKAVVDIEKVMELSKFIFKIEITSNSSDILGKPVTTAITSPVVENQRAKGGINKIYYGIPGCGKSYKIQAILEYEDGFQDDAKSLGISKNVDSLNIFRTTFYLDYSNSDFVGQLMPKTNSEGKVMYKPVLGPFTKALKRALETDEMVFLVIEEINRGNAAAIFGDIFQLLDRYREDKGSHKKGESMYPITNDFIEEYLGIPTGQVIIPSNMSILATMNTSDQNVLPLDTAFKRRWDRERVVPNWDDPQIKGLVDMYVPGTSKKWSEFAKIINYELSKGSKDGMILEDKQLGPFYVGKDILCDIADEDDIERIQGFVNNVVDYLYNDVTKFDHSILFESFNGYDDLYDRIFESTQEDKCIARGALYGIKLLQMKKISVGEQISYVTEGTIESEEEGGDTDND